MHRGQEDLWEDPEKGRPWNGPAAVEVAAAPAQLQPLPIELEAPEPEMPEFNLEEELAELEKETKVRNTTKVLSSNAWQSIRKICCRFRGLEYFFPL